jgi:UDP-3-O-[3-hydroxymyristoyl] N-acetylglucosamine deacetylase
MLQTTLKRSVSFSGVGLHSGRKVDMRLLPASEDTGIQFFVKKGSAKKLIPTKPECVVANGLSTMVKQGEDHIGTVEHLLAAIRGMEIDNIIIEAEGGETPIMDGSAAPFVFLLRSAGLRVQSKPRKVYALTKPFAMERDGKWIKASPYNGVRIDYTIDFPHPAIGVQSLSCELSPDQFKGGLAKARTFGFLRDVENLQKNGLALGGSLDNAVVLDDYSVINTEGLRFPDEFVRHKLMDFIGDMALLGKPLYGRFEVYCSGHALNNAFLRTIHANSDIYLKEVVLREPERAPAFIPAAARISAPQAPRSISAVG